MILRRILKKYIENYYNQNKNILRNNKYNIILKKWIYQMINIMKNK